MRFPIEVPAVMTRYNRKADRSVSLTFVTNREMSNEELSHIDEQHQASGHLLFAPNAFESKDIPKEPASDCKKPSARLRDVLYVLYKQTCDGDDFEPFYRARIEKIIDMVKAKLD